MKIRSLKLKDVKYGNQWKDEVEDHWEYDDFKANKDWREGWISMDCAYYNEDDNKVYLGITSFDADIMKAFNRDTSKFEDLEFKKISDSYDAKFHRSLVKRNLDGCIYGAIALLHCSDKYWEAPGGAIVKYSPKTGEIKKIGIHMPHTYIQSIVIDQEKDLLYCQCFPPEYLITYNLKTAEIKNLGLIGSSINGMVQGETIELDDNGTLWGPCGLTRAWQSSAGCDSNRIFRVIADSDKIEFLKTGLPKKDGSYGYEKMESIFNLKDGFMYASGANGSIYRIDTITGVAELLFQPISDRPSRLTSLRVAPDDFAYGVIGREGNCELIRFDYINTKYDLLGKIVNNEGEVCWQVHDISIANDGTIYACENDNIYRSGYLWEIKL